MTKNVFKYIDWINESEVKIISNEDFVAKYNLLDNKKRINSGKTLRLNWSEGSWCLEKRLGKYYILFLRTGGKYYRFQTNFKDNGKNDLYQDPETGKWYTGGQLAYEKESKRFEERTGVKINKAFGTTDEEFKKCIPHQFYYVNTSWINNSSYTKVFNHISSTDFCSQYPTNLCGRMPNSKTAKTVKGRVAPDSKYPFAFYLKTGLCAEYEAFDMHDWFTSKYAYNILTKYQIEHYNTPDEEEVTVLMEASEYTFDEDMKYWYTYRKTDEIAKLIMVAFIGMLHTQSYNSHKYAHLAAITIARSNEKMRHLAEDVIKNNIIHICVDGCIYAGTKMYGVLEKKLGNLYQEFVDADVRITGQNTYVAQKFGKVIKFKHGAFDARKDNKNIEECEGFNDIDQWIRSPKTEFKDMARLIINREDKKNEL